MIQMNWKEEIKTMENENKQDKIFGNVDVNFLELPDVGFDEKDLIGMID